MFDSCMGTFAKLLCCKVQEQERIDKFGKDNLINLNHLF